LTIKKKNSKHINETESLEPEPRDEQFNNLKKRIPNSKMKLNHLYLNKAMNIQQFKQKNYKLKDDIESLKPEPRDEQSSNKIRESPTQI
jgi:hypothetical protein